MNTSVSCKIEHHAMMFAFLSKHTITTCGKDGEKIILKAMTIYGKERGRRMALNALANGDELNTLTNQAYGEWMPDEPGQMEFGTLQGSPSLQTYIAKCAWCDAWKKHDILEFGRHYCLNVDNAVYQGFREDFTCTPISTSLSWGGDCCKFDWGHSLSDEELLLLKAKKADLGTRFMKDFNFHTAHLKTTLSKVLVEELGDTGKAIIEKALDEFVSTFGQEYLDVVNTVSEKEIYPWTES